MKRLSRFPSVGASDLREAALASSLLPRTALAAASG